MTPTLTVVINAYNEEHHIEACIKSAQLLTKDILLVDTESTDRTVSLAKKNGVRVCTFPHSRYVEVSREFSIRKADGAWIFLLDADERMTSALAEEIMNNIREKKYSYYKIPRATYFGKKWLKWGGWYPDMVIKLVEKKNFIGWPAQIHSSPKMRGAMGMCTSPLQHFSQPRLEHMVARTAVYEDVESALLFSAGVVSSPRTLFRKFFGELWRRMIVHLGFLDGTHGVIESLYQAFSKTMTYIFLYEKNKKSSSV